MHSGKVSSVTFFFPYHDVSGVPVLFTRMARHLAANYGLKTQVIDYADGYMSTTLANDDSVTVMAFNDGVPIQVGPDTVLVMQSILPATMRSELEIDPATPILFWTLHPMNWIPTIIPTMRARDMQAKHPKINKWVMRTLMSPMRHQLAGLLSELNQKHSLAFMDGTNLTSTCERLGIRIDDPVFIPVSCEIPSFKQKAPPNLSSDRGWSFGWLGRIEDFKTPILVHTVQELSSYAARTQTKIVFHVIGNGQDMQQVEILRSRVEHQHFELILAGVVTGSDLDAYLLERIDLLTAMGTSALEGAKLGVPTVLLDAYFDTVPDGYPFRWLSDSDSFGLGSFVVTDVEKGNDSLEKIVTSLADKYEELSDNSYQYCLANHSIQSSAEKLMDALQAASFRYADFPPNVLKKGVIRKAYELVRQLANTN
jgi:hypothetical protein